MKKILSTILALVAFIGCAHPIDSIDPEDIGEAEGAFVVHPDPSGFKASGATYHPDDNCVRVGGVNHYLRLVDGAWTLSTSSAAPSRRILPVTFDRIMQGTMIDDPGGEYDHVVHVPEGTYLPNQGETTESEAWHTLIEGTFQGQPYAVLGSP